MAFPMRINRMETAMMFRKKPAGKPGNNAFFQIIPFLRAMCRMANERRGKNLFMKERNFP